MHSLSVSKKEVGRAGDRLVSQFGAGENIMQKMYKYFMSGECCTYIL